ncbi:MAG: glucose-1-phosphate cytidylyltransferase [Candidatus Pacebacteria bacterium]|nr:glucose-1-phosphate cytidylyltransferase [Candidatus Paceibacterota bacterium]
MKVVILCGGKGTRMREETEFRPKPMVEIGGRPLLWHIMHIYSNYGFKDFIICLGYKGNMIKQYFLNYEAMNNDFTIQLGNRSGIQYHNNHKEADWNVTLVDTGADSQTGARVKKVKSYIDDNTFMLTYGDGVSNVNVRELLEYHKSHGKIGTMTGVHPPSRFGELLLKENRVELFNEKPQTMKGLVNGGFFVFNKSFFDYLDNDEGCILEKKPLEELSVQGELMVFPHEGFWQCVDTYRELEMLNNMWKSSDAPWLLGE